LETADFSNHSQNNIASSFQPEDPGDASSLKSEDEFVGYNQGVMIKKYKLSNISAIIILLAADLGIGYFTLPSTIYIDISWCKEIPTYIRTATVMMIANCLFGMFSCYLFI